MVRGGRNDLVEARSKRSLSRGSTQISKSMLASFTYARIYPRRDVKLDGSAWKFLSRSCSEGVKGLSFVECDNGASRSKEVNFERLTSCTL